MVHTFLPHDLGVCSREIWATLCLLNQTCFVKLIGFSIRISSSFLWVQIYRPGVSSVNTTTSREADFDMLKIRDVFVRKLIGAWYFSGGYPAAAGMLAATFNSPRDTRDLSTAGGGFLSGASIFGYGNGTAKDGSPRARVAAYKACLGDCFEANIMAAFDAAIHDGVDVLSVSLGGYPNGYYEDGLAMTAIHAVKNGITMVFSAGNDGPQPGSVSNTAP